jgi:hypothetical protein
MKKWTILFYDDEEEVGETRLPNAMLHLFHSDSETS